MFMVIRLFHVGGVGGPLARVDCGSDMLLFWLIKQV